MRKILNGETYLSQYYAPLDVKQVFKDYKELSQKNLLDANNYMRQAILKDPFVLAAIIWPKLIWQNFHRHYIEHLIYNREALLLGPRGHGKSKCTAKLLPIWLILNNRNARIIMASGTKGQSKKNSKDIRVPFEPDNALMNYLFGDFKSNNWLKDEWTVCARDMEVDGPTLASYGSTSGSVTGSHPDYLIVDDGVDIEHFKSSIVRENFRDFVEMTLDPTRDLETQVSWVGTRYHPQDYYSELLTSNIPVNPLGRACFLEDPQEVPIINMTQCLWPEEKTADFFYKKLEKHGEANFKTQFFNDSDLLGGHIWSRDMFRETNSKHGGQCIMGIDTAYAKGSINDWSAYAIVRRCASTQKFVIEEAEKGRWSLDQFRDLIYEKRKKYPIKQIVIEKFLKSKPGNYERHGLYDMLRENRGHINPEHMGNLPVRLIAQIKDKFARYHDIVGQWESGNVLHRPGMSDLEGQLLAIPHSQFDDIADAVEIAISTWIDQGRKKGGRFKKKPR